MYCEQCVFRSRKCARSLSSSLTGKKTDILRQLLKSKTAAARTRGLTSAKSAVSAALSGVRGSRCMSLYVCVCSVHAHAFRNTRVSHMTHTL